MNGTSTRAGAAGEVGVGGDRGDAQSAPLDLVAETMAIVLRVIEHGQVRPLAHDLHAVVAEVGGEVNRLLQRQPVLSPQPGKRDGEECGSHRKIDTVTAADAAGKRLDRSLSRRGGFVHSLIHGQQALHHVAFVVAAVATGISSQESTGGTWPPPVQQVRPESPALSPAEALKTFTLPPGYRLELVASEPLVQDPVVIDWDAEGRIGSSRCPDSSRRWITPEPNLDPIGRVVVLEDTDHDGVMDKRTVFADGLILARAIKVLEHGMLVGEPPNLWLMRDTNGDLHADTRELVTTGTAA